MDFHHLLFESPNLIFTKSNIISISSVISSTFDVYCYAGIGATLLVVLLTYVLIEKAKLKTSQKYEKCLLMSDIITRFVGSTFK